MIRGMTAISAVVTTDSGGSAGIDVVPSSMITLPLLVAGVGGVPALMLTLAGVQPGDALVFGSLDSGGASTPITVTMPGAFAGATQYTTTAGCGSSTSSSGTGPASISYDPSCEGGVIFAVAKDSTGKPIAWTEAKIADPPQSSVALNPWSSNFSSGTLQVIGNAGTNLVLDAAISPMIGSASFPGSALGTIGVGSTPFELPAGFGQRWSTELATTIQTSANEGYDSILTRVTDQVPNNIAFNTTDMLPGFSNLSVDLATPERPSLSWVAQTGLSAADMGLGLNMWDDGNSFGQWIVLFPPGDGSTIQIPELPESMASLRPAGLGIQSALYFVDTDFIDGYDEARANPNLEGLLGSDAPFTPPTTGPYQYRASISAGPTQ